MRWQAFFREKNIGGKWGDVKSLDVDTPFYHLHLFNPLDGRAGVRGEYSGRVRVEGEGAKEHPHWNDGGTMLWVHQEPQWFNDERT